MTMARFEGGGIDFAWWFMPQDLTPLYYTPIYRELTEEQRLRYNQLNALYFNEQIMFFERTLAQNVIAPFLRCGLPAEVSQGLSEFLHEECEHSALFLGLNRQCAPALYRGREFFFVRVSPVAKAILAEMSKRPRIFPLFLWMAHLQEERSMFFGRSFLRSKDDLEPHFVALQRRHLADEAQHVKWDAWLLDRVWPETAHWIRQLNARIFGWMIAEFFCVPKRSALSVVQRLVVERPELQKFEPRMMTELRELGRDLRFCQSVYSRENVPHTLARFDAWPEMRVMSRYLPGYLPA